MWPDRRVVAELDGRAVHDSDRLYETDRVRDRKLQVEGWKTTRITWRQMHHEAADTAADLRALLGCG